MVASPRAVERSLALSARGARRVAPARGGARDGRRCPSRLPPPSFSARVHARIFPHASSPRSHASRAFAPGGRSDGDAHGRLVVARRFSVSSRVRPPRELGIRGRPRRHSRAKPQTATSARAVSLGRLVGSGFVLRKRKQLRRAGFRRGGRSCRRRGDSIAASRQGRRARRRARQSTRRAGTRRRKPGHRHEGGGRAGLRRREDAFVRPRWLRTRPGIVVTRPAIADSSSPAGRHRHPTAPSAAALQRHPQRHPQRHGHGHACGARPGSCPRALRRRRMWLVAPPRRARRWWQSWSGNARRARWRPRRRGVRGVRRRRSTRRRASSRSGWTASGDRSGRSGASPRSWDERRGGCRTVVTKKSVRASLTKLERRGPLFGTLDGTSLFRIASTGESCQDG